MPILALLGPLISFGGQAFLPVAQGEAQAEAERERARASVLRLEASLPGEAQRAAEVQRLVKIGAAVALVGLGIWAWRAA